MAKIQWWQDGAVYQIYPRSFKDSNDDGIGDIPGIIGKLDYLKELGIGAIWLSPFYKSPMADFGYDVADYCDVDPMFGTLADFDELVNLAHERGIKMLIDWVPNHTSDQHAWFQESRQDRTNPKADWYIWRDAKPDGSLPNNWGSMFGDTAWMWDDQRRQYYFRQFAPEQPDLNWRNPDVKKAMLDVLRFWLMRGVDGFRMDVVNMIWKHPDMPDQPQIPDIKPRSSTDIYYTQQHLYDQDYEGVHGLMHEIRQVLEDSVGEEKLMIGEIWLPMERWKEYFGSTDVPEFQLPFNFRLILQDMPWTAEIVKQEILLMEENVPPHGFPNYVLNNHDNRRFTTRVGVEHARSAAMLLLTLRGTPTIYNGEEIEMIDGIIPEDRIVDPMGRVLGPKYNRDVCRTPFQWDDSAFAGFGNVEPWLPVNPDYPTLNAAAQINQPHSMFTLYQRLLTLRKQEAAFSIGALTIVDTQTGVLAYTRTQDSKTYVVVLNFTSEPISVPLPYHGNIVLDTDLKRAGEIVENEIALGANEGIIVEV